MLSRRKQTAKRRRRTASLQDSGAGALPTLFKSTLFALPLCLGFGLLLLLITTAFLLKTADPDRYHTIAGAALLYVTAFFGGMITTKLHNRRTPVLCGLTAGTCLFLLFSLLALILPGEATKGAALTLLFRLSLLPLSVLGAMLAAKRKQRHRRH